MSVSRAKAADGGTITISCDDAGCHRNYEAESLDFSEAMAEAREYGWSSSQFTGIWKNHCPTCTAKLGG